MPDDLKAWLKNKASQNFRSLNGEIVARLEGGKDPLVIEVTPKSDDSDTE
ncbi:hypothetical protein C7W93_19380 [Glaciimonas sp. PCH181]|nr:hypothetical protein C7W93_19380 [Glaciimonas sp. PCH181]